MNILLGVSGSVAAMLTPKLQEALSGIGSIKTIVTRSAEPFIQKGLKRYPYFSDKFRYETDADEADWQKKGDPILHIDLRAWADVMVLAPLTANTLAKISSGMADNIVTNTVRAWDYSKPMVLVPVMNPSMWANQFTEKQLDTMKSLSRFNVHIMEPVEKTMMCGEYGKGAMPDIDNIVKVVSFSIEMKSKVDSIKTDFGVVRPQKESHEDDPTAIVPRP